MRRLVRALERLRDSALANPPGESQAFAFGARDLIVSLDAGAQRGLSSDGLLAATDDPSGADTSPRLYSVTDRQLSALPFPADAALAPYGALTESLGTGWLVLWSPDTRKFLAYDVEGRVALFFPGDRVAPRERAEFARPLLHWLAVLDGHVVVHAGAAARDGRALLIAGAGNAGKSTLCRALIDDGWCFLGDNVIEVGQDSVGTSTVFGAYPTVKVRPHGVLPIANGWPAPEWDDEAHKDIYFLGGTGDPRFLTRSAILAATWVLDELGADEVRPIGRGEAFFKVAPNTVAQFPFFEHEVLKRSGAAVSAVPAVHSGRVPLHRLVASAEMILEGTRPPGRLAGVSHGY